MNPGNTSKTKKAIIAGIAVTGLVGSAMMLSGCAGQVDIGGFTFGGSTHTSDTDKENVSVIQDINGNEFTTVLEIFPASGLDIDDNELKSKLQELGINYYQVIIANSMGTPTQEDAHLYMTPDVTYTTLTDICNQINATGEYTATIMTVEAYDQWVSKTSNSIDVTRNDTTYMGPAAQS